MEVPQQLELAGDFGYNARPVYPATAGGREFTHSFMLGCPYGIRLASGRT